MNPTIRIKELVNEINSHNYLYYVNATQKITDQQYDDLVKELINLEKDNPQLVQPDSPSKRVGSELSGNRITVEHTRKMLSLDNTYNEQELRDFDKRIRNTLKNNEITYSAELKIDGAAVSLWYENGILVKGLTRGDGVVGEDITNNIKTIQNIPLKLKTEKPPKFVEIRGEVYMPRKVFAAINKKREEEGVEDPFANPRNAAAGSMKQKDPKEVAERGLAFFAHTYGKTDGFHPEGHSEFLLRTKSWGLTPVRSKICKDIEKVWKLVLEIDGLRKVLDYDTDGIVVKVDSLASQKLLGHTSKAPRYAIAYKYPTEQVETILVSIDIQVGKTGVLTPVGRLKPVHLGGSMISNVSLCNQDEINRLDCRPGDYVMIQKSGEIIPKIISVLTKKRLSNLGGGYQIQMQCPACNAKAIRKDGEVAIKCTNSMCRAKLQALVEYFVSRKCMDIDGIGDSLITKLIDAGLLKNPSDLYFMIEEDFMSLDGVKSSASKYVKNIAASKVQDLSRLLAALNIPMIGITLGEVLATHFGSLKNLQEATLKDLENIEKVGTEKAKAVVSWFENKVNIDYIDRLVSAGVNTKNNDKKVKNSLFESKTFVLTGTMENYSRDEASSIIKKRGGKTSGSVSKKTDYVLAGEKAGSKLKKAKALGVKVLSEADFENMITQD